MIILKLHLNIQCSWLTHPPQAGFDISFVCFFKLSTTGFYTFCLTIYTYSVVLGGRIVEFILCEMETISFLILTWVTGSIFTDDFRYTTITTREMSQWKLFLIWKKSHTHNLIVQPGKINDKKQTELSLNFGSKVTNVNWCIFYLFFF